MRHVPVVDHDAEVVGRRAVGTGDHQIVELAVGELDAALDQVVPGRDAADRIAEAHHRGTPAGGYKGSTLPGSGRQRPS
jgi:hypothetical protein